MWSFIDEYLNYIKIGLAVLAACICFYGGFHLGSSRYLEYKASVEAIAKEQEEKVKSIRSQQELVNKGIQNEYDAKLSLLRQYYANGVRNNNGGNPVSGISSTTKLSDAIAAYNQLASDCAATTLQTVTLQQWINEQLGVK